MIRPRARRVKKSTEFYSYKGRFRRVVSGPVFVRVCATESGPPPLSPPPWPGPCISYSATGRGRGPPRRGRPGRGRGPGGRGSRAAQVRLHPPLRGGRRSVAPSSRPALPSPPSARGWRGAIPTGTPRPRSDERALLDSRTSPPVSRKPRAATGGGHDSHTPHSRVIFEIHTSHSRTVFEIHTFPYHGWTSLLEESGHRIQLDLVFAATTGWTGGRE